MSDRTPDHVPDGWTTEDTIELEATLESRDLIEDVLIVGLLGPIVLAIGTIVAAPIAGVAWRAFTWAAGL